MKLSDEEIADVHRGNVTRLDYRLRWARYYLKREGYLQNSGRGVWSLTEKGQKQKSIDSKQLVKDIVAQDSLRRKGKLKEPDESDQDEVEELSWQEELLDSVLAMSSEAFERLSQRLLRELGFKNVEVTGRSGDGGIDGKGILKIGPVVTFSVVFQCKKYRGSVSAGAVRDFRGALQGRADKGLLITTGSFTRDARAEAQRDGALAIDLMDGSEFATRLKELGLGVQVEMVEKVTIDKDWYARF
jgi:restriction system protein